jgi:hypothetical protein
VMRASNCGCDTGCGGGGGSGCAPI